MRTCQACWLILSGAAILLAPLAGRAQSPADALPQPARLVTPWYADAEFAVLFNTSVHYDSTFYRVPGGGPTYVSPRVFLGYRFDEGDSLRFTYRNLTQVTGTNTSYEGYSSHYCFGVEFFDLDYVTAEFALTDYCRFQWEAGGRVVFRHSSYKNESSYFRQESNYGFVAGGPHLGLMTHFLLGETGWALFGRADAAITFGRGTSENTNEYPGYNDPFGLSILPERYSNRSSHGGYQFDLNVQAGLTKRWAFDGYSVGLGVGGQFEMLTMGTYTSSGAHYNFGGRWDSVGLVNIGPYLRCEVAF